MDMGFLDCHLAKKSHGRENIALDGPTALPAQGSRSESLQYFDDEISQSFYHTADRLWDAAGDLWNPT